MKEIKTLEDLDLTPRSYNNLRRAGINTIDELVALSYDDLCCIHNLGIKQVIEIRVKLMDAGLIKKNIEFKAGDLKVSEFKPKYDLIEFVNNLMICSWNEFKEKYSDKYIASVMDYDDSKSTSILLY